MFSHPPHSPHSINQHPPPHLHVSTSGGGWTRSTDLSCFSTQGVATANTCKNYKTLHAVSGYIAIPKEFIKVHPQNTGVFYLTKRGIFFLLTIKLEEVRRKMRDIDLGWGIYWVSSLICLGPALSCVRVASFRVESYHPTISFYRATPMQYRL